MYQRLGMVELQTWGINKDIRKCPRCRNLIEKTGGCEKVDCICGAGMCWDCMELWDENGQCRCFRTEIVTENVERDESPGRDK